MNTLYTIVTKKDNFVYLDMGDFKEDNRLPRRSTTFNDVTEAQKKLDRMNKKMAEQIAEWEADKIAHPHIADRYDYCIEDISAFEGMRVVEIVINEV